DGNVRRMLAEGRKILLFSQFTSMLSLIEEELKQRGIAYALLTGSTRDRRTPIHDFQSGKLPIFLISLKAGGTGLNLTAADTVIHYDPWWNPAAENQATDRAYRIGQDKPVFVYKMIARGTVEEKIQRLQREKSALAAGVLDGRTSGDWKLRDEDLQALFAPLPAAPKKTRK
ncbi:SWF/SNF helicase family protein, partial [Pseudomonas syringae pv. actinidiae]|nr:SWF/SNF helicase family protein [Pseudomonas syringae pv. actinidiae]